MKLLIWNKVGDKKEFKLKDLKEVDFDAYGVVVTKKDGKFEFYPKWIGKIEIN